MFTRVYRIRFFCISSKACYNRNWKNSIELPKIGGGKMELKVGTEITAETIFEKVITGKVTSILEKSVVIENMDCRHVVKKESLKNMGYTMNSQKQIDNKRIYIEPNRDGRGKGD